MIRIGNREFATARTYGVGAVLLMILAGCSDNEPQSTEQITDDANRALRLDGVFDTSTEVMAFRPAPNSERNAYYGDLHVHTTYSFDAFAMGTIATPYDAYRFAKGEGIAHPAGFEMKLKEPLDFYAVTDHAMFLGVAAASADTSTDFSKNAAAEPLHNFNAPENNGTGLSDVTQRMTAFGSFLPRMVNAIEDGALTQEDTLSVTHDAWADIIKAADEHNVPGRFTTFVGFEYTTSSDDSGNLHRNVIFKDSDRLPEVPFSRFHSRDPERLWDWMDGLRDQGVEAIAIPHNSNGSNGQMFKLVDWAGDPMDDAYTEKRLRNEPLVEITQIKGTSETHPALSTRDEWADFEILPYRIASSLESEPNGSYVRQALRRGLALEKQGAGNPYAFGFIGSSDTHTGASQNDESNYVSKLGLVSATPELRGTEPLGWLTEWAVEDRAPNLLTKVDGKSYLNFGGASYYGASGLAAVWAEENTREAIYAAFRRKETFATSGPRLKLRFFGGFDYDDGLMDAADAMTKAYAQGVPMGGDLQGTANRAPSFFVMAAADPESAPLQRLQIIKGWIDEAGETYEEVIDIACAGGAQPDAETNRCPDNGAKVNLDDCSINPETGVSELKILWKDPSFDPQQRAFYYARVLENPTCRWSTWDALRLNIEPRADLAATLQERAWSSPIHYKP